MPALQAMTGGKLLFQRQTFRLSTRPVTPLALLTRLMALRAEWCAFAQSGGALPHTPLPFVPKGSEKHFPRFARKSPAGVPARQIPIYSALSLLSASRFENTHPQ